MKARLSTVLAITALLGGALFAVSTPAAADSQGTLPSGCSISPTAPGTKGYLPNKPKVTFGGSARCGGSTTGVTFKLVHNYNGLPDAVAATGYMGAVGTGSYSNSYSTCDNGGTTEYYTEIQLHGWGSTIQRASGNRTITHC